MALTIPSDRKLLWSTVKPKQQSAKKLFIFKSILTTFEASKGHFFEVTGKVLKISLA